MDEFDLMGKWMALSGSGDGARDVSLARERAGGWPGIPDFGEGMARGTSGAFC